MESSKYYYKIFQIILFVSRSVEPSRYFNMGSIARGKINGRQNKFNAPIGDRYQDTNIWRASALIFYDTIVVSALSKHAAFDDGRDDRSDRVCESNRRRRGSANIVLIRSK